MPRRVDALEGVRALAALWVVCSHLWISQFGMAARRGALGAEFDWLLYSHFAVDVFIVLSGFCLFLPVVREGNLRGGPVGFWKRRARRILPPLYLSLALSVGVALLLQKAGGVPVQLDGAALGVNLLLLQDLFLSRNIFNGPLWSVAVEWRLSVLFPLLAWILMRHGAKALLLTTAVAGYALTAAVLHFAPALLMSCPWYGLLFGMGMCAAQVNISARKSWTVGAGAFVLLALALYAFPVDKTGVAFGLHMPLIDPLVGVLTALLLLRLRSASAVPVLTWPILVGLGQFSYSLYLTHAPLLRLLRWGLTFAPFWEPLSALTRFAVLVAGGLPLLVGAAYLFYLGCERPFLHKAAHNAARRQEPRPAALNSPTGEQDAGHWFFQGRPD